MLLLIFGSWFIFCFSSVKFFSTIKLVFDCSGANWIIVCTELLAGR
jgi:hypothetical protein